MKIIEIDGEPNQGMKIKGLSCNYKSFGYICEDPVLLVSALTKKLDEIRLELQKRMQEECLEIGVIIWRTHFEIETVCYGREEKEQTVGSFRLLTYPDLLLSQWSFLKPKDEYARFPQIVSDQVGRILT